MRSIATQTHSNGLFSAWQRDADWLDGQYNNRSLVPDYANYLNRWARDSARVRATQTCQLDVAYGSGSAETLDIFPAANPSGSVLVFIHGGYWRTLDKSDHSLVAPAFTNSGTTVVVPNYSLCPAVTIDAIALEMTRAVQWVWHHAPAWGGERSRIMVAGHSAGGHLAAMMLSCDWSVVDAQMPAAAVTSALSLSGIFDLEPLQHAPFLQQDLRLTPALVQANSPARFARPKGRLRVVVGEDESREFHRQSQLIESAWGATQVPLCAAMPGCNHFAMFDELARVGSSTHRVALNALQT